MSYLIGFADSDGMLVFEADRGEISSDLVLASPDIDEVVHKARLSLQDALGKLRPSLQKIVHTLKELSPDETTVEFGLKIGGETGVIIAKGTSEVNFVIRMSWKSE